MPRAAGRTRPQDLPIRAEINVTSLVDVAFTLLVIFIITGETVALEMAGGGSSQ